jgi:hypothetical protein
MAFIFIGLLALPVLLAIALAVAIVLRVPWLGGRTKRVILSASPLLPMLFVLVRARIPSVINLGPDAEGEAWYTAFTGATLMLSWIFVEIPVFLLLAVSGATVGTTDEARYTAQAIWIGLWMLAVWHMSDRWVERAVNEQRW